ncbi:hypothetical protein ACJZ2D_000262 [Fusarium nematophilum]
MLSEPSLSQPGLWNLGTAAIILSGASESALDIFGQLVLVYLADVRSRQFAMFSNASSVLVFALLCSILPIRVAVVAPLLKCFGGGSHASAFLTLAVPHHQPVVHRRFVHYPGGPVFVLLILDANWSSSAASYYARGSVVVFRPDLGFHPF